MRPSSKSVPLDILISYARSLSSISLTPRIAISALIPSSPQSHSRLINLPAELRLKILSFSSDRRNEIRMCTGATHEGTHSTTRACITRPEHFDLNLHLVCKQFCREMSEPSKLSMYDIFVFCGREPVIRFLLRVDDKNRAMVRHLKFQSVLGLRTSVWPICGIFNTIWDVDHIQDLNQKNAYNLLSVDVAYNVDRDSVWKEIEIAPMSASGGECLGKHCIAAMTQHFISNVSQQRQGIPEVNGGAWEWSKVESASQVTGNVTISR